MKSDNSIRAICIAAINRHTVKPFDFLLTRFFKTETFSEILNGTFKLSDIAQNELPISQTVADRLNWTLVTTRQIISCVDGITKIANPNKVQSWHWDNFKGYDRTSYTIGQLQLDDQQGFEIFIETG